MTRFAFFVINLKEKFRINVTTLRLREGKKVLKTEEEGGKETKKRRSEVNQKINPREKICRWKKLFLSSALSPPPSLLIPPPLQLVWSRSVVWKMIFRLKIKNVCLNFISSYFRFSKVRHVAFKILSFPSFSEQKKKKNFFSSEEDRI